ncbi:MAG: hypothetical protein IJ943_02595, partial [Akkermansia sp.]|nr:hypothetical protein [Akkermansia sp.]
GPTEGRRMGLSFGHLPALRVPRRGSHLLFPPYPGLREPDGSLTPRYSLSPWSGFKFGGRNARGIFSP